MGLFQRCRGGEVGVDGLGQDGQELIGGPAAAVPAHVDDQGVLVVSRGVEVALEDLNLGQAHALDVHVADAAARLARRAPEDLDATARRLEQSEGELSFFARAPPRHPGRPAAVDRASRSPPPRAPGRSGHRNGSSRKSPPRSRHPAR